MLVRFSRALTAIGVSSVLALSAWAQSSAPATPAQPQKQVKDQGEYDLYNAILKEASAPKRLELLNTWKEKYAETDYKKERLLIYLGTYQQLNKPKEMIDMATMAELFGPLDLPD